MAGLEGIPGNKVENMKPQDRRGGVLRAGLESYPGNIVENIEPKRLSCEKANAKQFVESFAEIGAKKEIDKCPVCA